MYDQLSDDREATSPDETRVKRGEDDDKEGASLSAAGTPGSYGSTPVHEKPSDQFYLPCCAAILYVMTFLGIFCAFALRAALSEALVAMVNDTDYVAANGGSTNDSSYDDDDYNYYDQCPRDEDGESKYPGGELNWDREQESVVLAAFYYGHLFALVCSIPCKQSLPQRSYRNRYSVTNLIEDQ